jgi:hypothetical protein
VRPGTAEHVAALPGTNVAELDLPAVLALARDDTWAAASTRYVAEPTPDRPSAAVVAATDPGSWQGAKVCALDLPPRESGGGA